MKRYFTLIALLSAPLFAMQPTNIRLLQTMLRKKSNVHKMHHNEMLQQRFSSSNKDKNREERKKELVSQYVRLHDLEQDQENCEAALAISKGTCYGTVPFSFLALSLDITEFANTGSLYLDRPFTIGITSLAVIAGLNAVRKSHENHAINVAIKDAKTRIATMEDVNKTSEISMGEVD